MTMNDLEYGWRKNATQESVTHEDVERAFLDQAHIAISNKCRPLMKAPYRIGFEIVTKNSENTRMVGIFIFRVLKELFYAPVFFLNGSVKGTDLFYLHSKKRFVPMTNNWIEYLLNVTATSEGKGTPMQDRQNSRQSINMRDIINPPGTKQSSVEEASEDLHQLAVEAWAAIETSIKDASAIDSSAQPDSILKKFIVEDGGYNAITKISNAVNKDFRFAEALNLLSDPENFMPELLPYEKQAATSIPSPLVMHSNLLANARVKGASSEQLLKGYAIEDMRKDAEVNQEVFEADPNTLQTITEPGIYSVLTADSENTDMICAYPDVAECSAWLVTNKSPRSHMVVVDVANNNSDKCKELLGNFVGKIENSKYAKTTPETGKAYRIYNVKKGTLSEALYIIKQENNDYGMNSITASSFSRKDKFPKVLLLNPDYDGCDYDEGVLGSACRFIEVAHTVDDTSEYVGFPKNIHIGTRHTLNSFIFSNGYRRASITKCAGSKFILRGDDSTKRAGLMSKGSAVVSLMAVCALREAQAESIVETLEKSAADVFHFCYAPIAKEAHSLSFNDFPQQDNGYDPEFNTLTNTDSQDIIPTRSIEPQFKQHRVGDRYSGGSRNSDQLNTLGPMQLYQMSQNKGNQSIFEHGVVGALIETYDAMAMIDKYIPDLEQALDRIGRMLFLFYWKPTDFAEAFGTDDQTQMENKLISNFKAFGELVLELLMKNRDKQNGSPSLQ